ncbi:MAG: outer membrane protein assembly factor BamE [Gammaproteobacteria bacterium]|nr:outer membrane protein assembly factor BamE [Gammaproteobacteria bacterium]
MNTKTMRYALFPAILAALLSGCLSVYKVEVQQGNVVTQEMVDKLKPGMTRNQVRFVMGTPLVTDPFHPERWDYYYYLRRSNEPAGESQRVTVVFKNDTLVAVQGDTRIKSDTPATGESAVKPAPVKPDKSY